MLGDAHWTNYAENRDFFLNQNNPTNFERTCNTAYFLYKRDRRGRRARSPFDQVMDFSVIQKLGAEPKYADAEERVRVQVHAGERRRRSRSRARSSPRPSSIHFFPNSYDLDKKVAGEGRQGGEELYDPNVEFMVEEIGKLAGQFGAARIVIEGHTDASMKGVADESLVQELSTRRANAVKEALVNKFKMQPEPVRRRRHGWDKPADPKDPDNHAKNRRVEVKVVPAEAQ